MTFLGHGKDDRKLQGEILPTLAFFRTQVVDTGILILTVVYRKT